MEVKSLDWDTDRVTMTVLSSSGFGASGSGTSNADQRASERDTSGMGGCSGLRWSRRETTSPMTITQGDSDSPTVSSTMVSSVPTHIFWEAVPADFIAATGVEGLLPAAKSFAAMSSRLFPAIKMERVSILDSASQSSASTSCPVRTAKQLEMSVLVRGMPSNSGAAKAVEIPGTTSKSQPEFRKAAISNAARPKTNGSPHLRRTTDLPS
mmetsp:Transcript_17877/g.30837  ORF Transcript_17877/g.30837 Transcript_17877/m.30837 type:complete len:210 (+) Transcript_17877:1633-2262(+)